jgi:hypothetical protein
MKRILCVCLLAVAFGCGSQDTSDDANSQGERPRDVNEAITDSTKIVNDSAIMVDTVKDGQRKDSSGNRK